LHLIRISVDVSYTSTH